MDKIIVRKYRVTIPKHIRDKLGIKDGTILEVETRNEKIIMRVLKI